MATGSARQFMNWILVTGMLALGFTFSIVTQRGQAEEPRPRAPDTPAPRQPEHAERTAALTGELYAGQPLCVGNVTVWPVHTTAELPKLDDFVTLDQAQAQGEAQLEEISAAGAVPKLSLTNRGKLPIFVLEGTLVKGGKQDRQIAQSFIVQPGKTATVDAYCVERGRWSGQREGQATDGQFTAQKSLAIHGVRTGNGFQINNAGATYQQDRTWKGISQELAKVNKGSSTSTLMALVDESDPDAVARRDRFRAEFKKCFDGLNAGATPPVGFAYAVDGKAREIRSFAHPKIFALFRETLFNTVALEGDLAHRAARARDLPAYRTPADPQGLVAMVREAEKANEQRHRTQAGNENCYQQNGKSMRFSTRYQALDGMDLYLDSSWSNSE